ncbi:hypothetical protein [Sphingomonas sp.]|uniref:hypothetical protein n=1 Tax=Sphingomonas sp. TaxID=28214 RepID=UPI001B173BE0|nr:hypothetical protein [Sphingomonas sp.]MBO9712351.1 hypothetical protein [Sphingomonas sp.]
MRDDLITGKGDGISDAPRKPRWRTPKLVADNITAVTHADFSPGTDAYDGTSTSYGPS